MPAPNPSCSLPAVPRHPGWLRRLHLLALDLSWQLPRLAGAGEGVQGGRCPPGVRAAVIVGVLSLMGISHPTSLPAFGTLCWDGRCWVGGSLPGWAPCPPPAPPAGCHRCHQEIRGCFSTSEEHPDPGGAAGAGTCDAAVPEPAITLAPSWHRVLGGSHAGMPLPWQWGGSSPSSPGTPGWLRPAPAHTSLVPWLRGTRTRSQQVPHSLGHRKLPLQPRRCQAPAGTDGGGCGVGGRKRRGALRQWGGWQGHHPLSRSAVQGLGTGEGGGHSAGWSPVPVGVCGGRTHSQALPLPFRATAAITGVMGDKVRSGGVLCHGRGPHPCWPGWEAEQCHVLGGHSRVGTALPTHQSVGKLRRGSAVVGRGLRGAGYCHAGHAWEPQPRRSRVGARREPAEGRGRAAAPPGMGLGMRMAPRGSPRP